PSCPHSFPTLRSSDLALIDDRKPIRPRWRLVAQAVAATIAIVGGTYITDLGELLWAAEVPLPVWFAVPFTVFAMCGVINEVNMRSEEHTSELQSRENV